MVMEKWEVFPTKSDSHGIVHYQDEPFSVLEARPDTPVIVQEHSGQEVQRISVITNLPDLLQDNHADCMRRVVPKVREVLHVAQTEMQLAASSAFLQILQRELIPIHNYASTFLQTILSSVDSKDPDVATAWLDTLLDVIDLLPKEVLKSDVLSIAVAKGQLSQSVQARLSCCKILGKIATKFEPFIIKKEILPVVQSLCQDVDYEVRGCMCQQLDCVARGLGLDATKSAILPELVELTNDEESYVRVTGLQTVVSVLSLLDDETCITTIIPLVTKFCQQAMQAEDTTLPVVAKQLGKICHGLQVNLDEDQKHWFVDFFKKLCRCGLSEGKKTARESDKDSPSKQMAIPDLFEEDQHLECRRNCAYNFPAMVLFVGARSFKAELFTTFSNMCKDPHVLVRKTMANGFHEIAKQLGSAVHFIQGDLMTLLKDDSIEVLQGIVSHLPETLEVLAKGGTGNITEAKMHSLSEVIPAILAADTVIFASNNWRAQEELMACLACIPKCCSHDAISNRIIPVLFQKLFTSRALPVRHSAARTLLILIRHLKKQEQREELIMHIVEDFCHGRSCYHRSLFIDICRFAIELYSKAFFKEHFFESILELTCDPVANIRLRMCSVLPLLKQLIKLPYDRNLLQQLEACVRRILINEKDRDVNVAIKQSVEDLDRIHVQMESVLSRRKNFEDDIEDQIKEDHEKYLIEQEEKDRKEEEARAAKGEKRAQAAGKKDNGSSKIPGPKKGAKTTKDSNKEIKRTPSTSSSSSTTMNTTKDDKGPIARTRNSHLVKSKSTTSIPSLSQIPRRDLQASRIPMKPKAEGLTTSSNISQSAPSVRESGIPKATASSNKTKTSLTTVRAGSMTLVTPGSAGVRKSSGGTLSGSGSVLARRGSLNSASSTGSESGTKLSTKSKSGTNGLAQGGPKKSSK